MFDTEVIGIKFTSYKQYGDFYWMCNQEKYSNSLFIFNDNEECHYSNHKGAGNAIMRIYNKHSKLDIPKSAGIPTGTLQYGGYTKFTPNVKMVIDNSFNEIIELIQKHKYKTIYFSSELDGKLGTSIFQVNPTIITYITNKIYHLSSKPIKIIKVLSNDHFDENIDCEDKI